MSPADFPMYQLLPVEPYTDEEAKQVLLRAEHGLAAIAARGGPRTGEEEDAVVRWRYDIEHLRFDAASHAAYAADVAAVQKDIVKMEAKIAALEGKLCSGQRDDGVFTLSPPPKEAKRIAAKIDAERAKLTRAKNMIDPDYEWPDDPHVAGFFLGGVSGDWTAFFEAKAAFFASRSDGAVAGRVALYRPPPGASFDEVIGVCMRRAIYEASTAELPGDTPRQVRKSAKRDAALIIEEMLRPFIADTALLNLVVFGLTVAAVREGLERHAAADAAHHAKWIADYHDDGGGGRPQPGQPAA